MCIYKCKNACSQSFPHKLHDIVMIRVNEQASEWVRVAHMYVWVLVRHGCTPNEIESEMFMSRGDCLRLILLLLLLLLSFSFSLLFLRISFSFCLFAVIVFSFATESRASVVIWCVPQRNVFICFDSARSMHACMHISTHAFHGVPIHSLTCCKYQIIDLAISTWATIHVCVR